MDPVAAFVPIILDLIKPSLWPFRKSLTCNIHVMLLRCKVSLTFQSFSWNHLLNVFELFADILVDVVVVDQNDLSDEGWRGAGEDGEHGPEERRSGLVTVSYDDRRGVGDVGDQRGPVL